jgi:ligand-binding sensor domain-containing protein
MRLTANGLQSVESGFEVNPNAMLVVGDHVYAGTLGRGLYVYDRASGRGRFTTAGLPSANVTALTARDGVLYIGTDNGLVRVAEGDIAQ